jgi:hypothetical protein
MTDHGQPGLPKQVAKRVASLRATRKDHLRLAEKVLRADGGNLFGVDFVVLAVLQRSLSLIDGFTLMLERRNALCAAPLIRLQIDSLLRLYACWLVHDPHAIAEKLLRGVPLSKVRSRDGQGLTDAYLRRKACERYPWVTRVYEKTSGFIHLSAAHMIAPVTGVHPNERSLDMCVGSFAREWREDEMVEAIDASAEATNSLLHLCDSWVFTKENARRDREAREGLAPLAD